MHFNQLLEICNLSVNGILECIICIYKVDSSFINLFSLFASSCLHQLFRVQVDYLHYFKT